MIASRLQTVIRQPSFTPLLMASLVTAPLVYYAARPVQIIEIHLIPSFAPYAQIPCKSVTTRAYNAPAFFEFSVENLGPDVKEVVLEIRSERDLQPQSQGAGYVVENGRASGVAQLGSDDEPLKRDEGYRFRVADRNGNQTLVDGTIVARVDELASPSPWILGVIGVFASVIQIVEVARRRRNSGSISEAARRES